MMTMLTMKGFLLVVMVVVGMAVCCVDAFAPTISLVQSPSCRQYMNGPDSTCSYMSLRNVNEDNDDKDNTISSSKDATTRIPFPTTFLSKTRMVISSIGLALAIASWSAFGVMPVAAVADGTYDGFADYAKENQMEQSDVGCFIQQCGDQTKALFGNPRGIKGVSCLGRCKGEQSCATRCFAEFGSEALNDWLSCTIEENECVKVPKTNIDNSAENTGYTTVVKNFDPSSLVGTWYKTDGLNPNYDLFDCQTNTFTVSETSETSGKPKQLDMGIFFRVRRPMESGGGYWENGLTERMVIDDASSMASTKTSSNDGSRSMVVPAANAATRDDMDNFGNPIPAGRTMHTEGKMYGLQFSENWFILGESNGRNNVPPFKLVAYKGHTLQGNYEGAFVYAKEPILPAAAIPAVREAAARGGLDFDRQFTRIDNTCPTGLALNDAEAGTGTSTTDWIDLVIGEGGVIDWISPGWRGEYKQQ